MEARRLYLALLRSLTSCSKSREPSFIESELKNSNRCIENLTDIYKEMKVMANQVGKNPQKSEL